MELVVMLHCGPASGHFADELFPGFAVRLTPARSRWYPLRISSSRSMPVGPAQIKNSFEVRRRGGE